MHRRLELQMNHPSMEGLRLNVPAYVKHARLIAWVADMAALTEAADVYWCDGSEAEYDRLCAATGRRRHLQEAEPGAAPEQLPGLQRPERRGARRRPHLHLLRAQGRRRPDQQLDGPGRDARAAADRRRQRAVPAAACAAARCTWCRSPWARWARTIAHIGVELSDSAYVAVNMSIMTRMGRAVLDVLGADGDFVPCVHTVGAPLAAGPERRDLAVQQDQVHRPLPRDARDLELRLGLRRQRAAGQEVLCAAHRLHHGPRPGLAGRAHADPGRDLARRARSTTWPRPSRAPAARPTSRCWCRRPASTAGRSRPSATTSPGSSRSADGRLYAINPEAGYFGVAPGTNYKTNPNCMAVAASAT